MNRGISSFMEHHLWNIIYLHSFDDIIFKKKTKIMRYPIVFEIIGTLLK